MTTTITNTVADMSRSQEATNERIFKMLTMLEAKIDKLEPSFPEKRFRTASGAHVNLEEAGGGGHAGEQGDDKSMAGEIYTACHLSWLWVPLVPVYVLENSRWRTHTCVCVALILSRLTSRQGRCMGMSHSQTRWYHSRSDETSIH